MLIVSKAITLFTVVKKIPLILSLAIFLGSSVIQVRAQDTSAAAISLPAGVTIATATPDQLATAVSAAVKANPGQAAAIVASVIGQLKRGDKEKAAAIITAVAAIVPNSSFPAIVYAAAKANPALAPTVAGAAAAAVPALAVTIARVASAAAPDQADAIAAAVTAAVPTASASAIAAASAAGASLGRDGAALSLILGTGPGGRSINPANTSGGIISES